MSLPSFRSRPIDITKPLEIIRRDLDEDDDDDHKSILRSLPQLPTGMEPMDEEESHIQGAIHHSGLEEDKIAIPIPYVEVVKGFDKSSNSRPFRLPKKYIQHPEFNMDEWLQKVEYDLEDDDYKFLKDKNKKRKLFTEDDLEFIIDRCEKEASKQKDKLPSASYMEKALSDYESSIVQLVYKHWSSKRKKNGGPLITALIPPPPDSDHDPSKPFRERKKIEKVRRHSRKDDIRMYYKMLQLRREMERARMLLELVKKREKTKKEDVTMMAEIFDIECLELDDMVQEERERKREEEKKKEQQRKDKERMQIATKRKRSRSTSPSPPPQRQKLNKLPPKEDLQKMVRKSSSVHNTKKHRSRKNQSSHSGR